MARRDALKVVEQLGLGGIETAKPSKLSKPSKPSKSSKGPREEHGSMRCDMCLGTGGHVLLGRCPSCRGSGRTRYIRHLDADGALVDVEIL